MPLSNKYKFEGNIYELEYFHFNVTNENEDAVNYSTGILRLNREGDQISGEFLARSRIK